MDKWDLRHYLLAMHVASWSKDPTTQVGAVVVGADRRHMALGYNGFPRGVRDDVLRYKDRPTKYLFTQHAERNALDNAQFSCTGGTLATTMFPCIECTKSIISKGIVRLITPPMPEPIAEPSWRDNCPIARNMLAEASVQITVIPEE
jgi:dCMP deaminase